MNRGLGAAKIGAVALLPALGIGPNALAAVAPLRCPVPVVTASVGSSADCVGAALRTDLGQRLDCLGVDLARRARDAGEPWLQLNLDPAHRWVRLELRVTGR